MIRAFITVLLLVASTCAGWTQDSKFPQYGLEFAKILVDPPQARFTVVDPIGGAEGKITFLFLDEKKNVVVSLSNDEKKPFENPLEAQYFNFSFTPTPEQWARIKSYDIVFVPRKFDNNRITFLEKEAADNAKAFKDKATPRTSVSLSEKIKQSTVEVTDATFTLVPPGPKETGIFCNVEGVVNVKNTTTRLMEVEIQPVLLTSKRDGLSAGRIADGTVPCRGGIGLGFKRKLDPGETQALPCKLFLLKRNWDKVQDVDLILKVRSADTEIPERRPTTRSRR